MKTIYNIQNQISDIVILIQQLKTDLDKLSKERIVYRTTLETLEQSIMELEIEKGLLESKLK